jgi:hypothetical protein
MAAEPSDPHAGRGREGRRLAPGSPDCIDTAVENDLIHRVLPAGTKCDQDVPFTAPEQAAAKRKTAAAQERVVRPLPRR